MRISYIPAVSNVPENLPGTIAAGKQLETSIANAITASIVEPFKAWISEVTTKALVLSEWGCILTCATGIILWICGIEKGKQITKVSAIVFVGLQIFKVVFLV